MKGLLEMPSHIDEFIQENNPKQSVINTVVAIPTFKQTL